MKNVIHRTIVLTFIATGLIFSFSPALSTADIKDDIQQGTDSAAGASGAGDPGTSLNQTVAGVVNVLSIIVGIVAVFMVILAGFRYITSGGEANKVASAKNALIYAIIGLVIVAVAQLIVRFVINTTTNPTGNIPSSSSGGNSGCGPQNAGTPGCP